MKILHSKAVLVFAMLLALTSRGYAASLPVSIKGDYLIRLPGSSRYIKDTFQKLPDNVIVSIPDVYTASSTVAILNGHRIKLYPGVTFKISNGALIPLSGRFEFSPDVVATSSISIVAHNCNAGYHGGHFLIEATPDNGTFFALKDNGTVWIKDIARNVFELKSGQQVHVPMFGKAVFKSRLESFWGKEPSGFNSLGEVGQETAYGIVGTDPTVKKPDKNEKSKKDSEESAEDKDIDYIDDDYLDPEEEAWLNSGDDAAESESLQEELQNSEEPVEGSENLLVSPEE